MKRDSGTWASTISSGTAWQSRPRAWRSPLLSTRVAVGGQSIMVSRASATRGLAGRCGEARRRCQKYTAGPPIASTASTNQIKASMAAIGWWSAWAAEPAHATHAAHALHATHALHHLHQAAALHLLHHPLHLLELVEHAVDV